MFATLAVIVAAGLLGPLLAAGRRPLLPVVVGELAAGVVLGQTGFHVIDIAASPAYPVFYQLGFAMLMLSAGTQIDVESPAFRRGVARGAVAFTVVALLAVPLAVALSQGLGARPFTLVAVLLAGSSAAVVVPIVEERQLKGPAISFLVAWIAVADAVTVVLLPLTLSGAGRLLTAIAGTAAIVAAGSLINAVARRVVFTPGAQSVWRASRDRGWALQLRLSVLLLLLLSAIADSTGASTLVAGFVAGMVLARLHQPGRLAVQFVGVANGFFVPIFFVLLGSRLDLRALLGDPRAIAVAGALAAGATAIHLVGAAVGGQRPRVALGLAASAQLGLPAAAAALGLSTHQLSPALAAAVMAAACFTLIPASLGAAMLGRRSGQP
jgi:Kef-type K+ transport system membrane component KefB